MCKNNKKVWQQGDCGKDYKFCNLSNKTLLKEISILWNNTDRRGQLISIIEGYFGDIRSRRIIDAIKRIK